MDEKKLVAKVEVQTNGFVSNSGIIEQMYTMLENIISDGKTLSLELYEYQHETLANSCKHCGDLTFNGTNECGICIAKREKG